MSEMSQAIFDSMRAVPNKLLQDDGTITDMTGKEVVSSGLAYDSVKALPNKFLNPDGSYSSLQEILADVIDTDLFIVVDELPASGEKNKIYLVPNAEGKFIEYIWVNNKWDPVGMMEFDLSKYSTTEQMNAAIKAALNVAKEYTDTQIEEKITQVLGGSY